MRKSLFIFILTSLFLIGCSSSSRYSITDDVAPNTPLSVEHIEDAHPQYEPYSLGGNKNYTLRGINYTIVKEAKGFTEKGQASWYGKKFHGHLTSNGEIYDMYSMTAAHKTLPLPSYVKVTNLDNKKTAIVRVNDRGPFHEGRIIDLSYAAAYKLGVVQTGTANVAIEVITIDKPITTSPQKKKAQYLIQVASAKSEQIIRTLSEQLSQTLTVESFVDSVNGSHRVFLGPFNDDALTQQTLEKVKLLGYETAFIKAQPVTQ